NSQTDSMNSKSDNPKKRVPEKKHYRNGVLFLIAFDKSYRNFFQPVDSNGNPSPPRYEDFDYDLLSDEQQIIFDEYCDSTYQYCEELYEQETRILSIELDENIDIVESDISLENKCDPVRG